MCSQLYEDCNLLYKESIALATKLPRCSEQSLFQLARDVRWLTPATELMPAELPKYREPVKSVDPSLGERAGDEGEELGAPVLRRGGGEDLGATVDRELLATEARQSQPQRALVGKGVTDLGNQHQPRVPHVVQKSKLSGNGSSFRSKSSVKSAAKRASTELDGVFDMLCGNPKKKKKSAKKSET